MSRKLLCLCVTMLALASYSQPPVRQGTIPADATVSALSALVANDKVNMSWNVNGPLPDFFTIERSENGKKFEVVTVLNNPGKKNPFQWTDDSPKKGRSFYRIKYSFGQGPELYSSTASVIIAGNIDLKFYPNPVDQLLIIRSEMPVDVQISDAAGKVRISAMRVSGLHTINVSSLEKGIYLIRFSNKLINVISQEKLVKN